MRVAYPVQEGDAFEELLQEALDQFEGEPSIVVFLDEFIEGGPQRLEDQAEVAFVHEGFFVSNDSLLIFLVTAVDVLDNLFFDLGRLHVFLNGTDHLRKRNFTFIA